MENIQKRWKCVFYTFTFWLFNQGVHLLPGFEIREYLTPSLLKEGVHLHPRNFFYLEPWAQNKDLPSGLNLQQLTQPSCAACSRVGPLDRYEPVAMSQIHTDLSQEQVANLRSSWVMSHPDTMLMWPLQRKDIALKMVYLCVWNIWPCTYSLNLGKTVSKLMCVFQKWSCFSVKKVYLIYTYLRLIWI